MPTKLTLTEMKEFVRNHFEGFVNRRNASVIHKNMALDFYDHDLPGSKLTGIDGDEEMMIAMYKAMPDLHVAATQPTPFVVPRERLLGMVKFPLFRV